MIAAIERWFAKRQKRRYRVCLSNLTRRWFIVRCARCNKPVKTRVPNAHLAKWFDALGTSEFSRVQFGLSRTRAYAFKDIDHQCEDLK